MTGLRPSSRRARTSWAIVFQLSAVDTLLPPNFMTTQGDVATSSGAPNALPSSKPASTNDLLIADYDLVIHHLTKKNPQGKPGGFGDNVRTLLLAGTVAIRTHAPLARHNFYVFYRIELVDTLAQYMGVVRIHRCSRADITQKVKPNTCYSSQSAGIVTAPSEADATALLYFAKAPRVTGEVGRVQLRRRCSIISSATFKLICFDSASM